MGHIVPDSVSLCKFTAWLISGHIDQSSDVGQNPRRRNPIIGRLSQPDSLNEAQPAQVQTSARQIIESLAEFVQQLQQWHGGASSLAAHFRRWRRLPRLRESATLGWVTRSIDPVAGGFW